MPERDPRFDPEPGDVLRDVFGVVCSVKGIKANIVTREKENGERSNVGLAYWRQWYRNATVLKRGDE